MPIFIETIRTMKRLSLLIAFFLTGASLYAQQVKAILVELNSEKNRVQYLKREGKTADAIIVLSEARKIRQMEILDFTNNFSYCPVYYFIDTNYSLIKEKQFAGVLLDTDGVTFVTSPLIKASDNNYLVVHYGYSDPNAISNSTRKGLAVYNDMLQQIYFIVAHPVDDAGKKSAYSSTKYDMDYLPVAEHFSDKMDKIIAKMTK